MTDFILFAAVAIQGVVLLFLFAKKGNEQAMIDRLVAENQELRVQQKQLYQELLDLKDRHAQLQTSIKLLESTQLDMPFPMWIKDTQGIMLFFNTAYERVFLTPMGVDPAAYIGHRDEDVWGEAGKRFWKNCQMVLRRKAPIEFEEDVPDGEGGTMRWRILKFPRLIGNTIVGIVGIAIPPFSASK